MKKLIAILFILLINVSFPQEKQKKPIFSTLQFGVFTGINFGTLPDKGGSILVEFNTNLISDFNLNLSLGYSKTFQSESYSVKTYHEGTINNTQYYWADDFNVTSNEYDIFPVSISAQYIFKNNIISPFLLFGINYNFISTRVNSTPGYSPLYTSSYDALPNEYKTKFSPSLPNYSYGISLGAGAIYPLSSKINLELRYLYKIDSEIINTNNIMVGISF